MQKDDLVKAAIAACGPGLSFGPAQLQKLFFVIDRELSAYTDGPVFNFKPYDYGPFDKDVYSTMNELEVRGLATITHTNRYRTYALTEQGYGEGVAALETLNQVAIDYIQNLSKWVRESSFQSMISAIYKQYPDMKENSIFQD